MVERLLIRVTPVTAVGTFFEKLLHFFVEIVILFESQKHPKSNKTITKHVVDKLVPIFVQTRKIVEE